jgi:hypothetical protein
MAPEGRGVVPFPPVRMGEMRHNDGSDKESTAQIQGFLPREPNV